jgi:hypothetical protein
MPDRSRHEWDGRKFQRALTPDEDTKRSVVLIPGARRAPEQDVIGYRVQISIFYDAELERQLVDWRLWVDLALKRTNELYEPFDLEFECVEYEKVLTFTNAPYDLLAGLVSKSNSDLKWRGKAAVLITGRKCVDPETGATYLGLANPGTLGSDYAVAFVSGYHRKLPRLSMTLAHELSHILGVGHDGVLPWCQERLKIMWPVINPYATEWSECSAKRLKEIIPTSESIERVYAPLSTWARRRR